MRDHSRGSPKRLDTAMRRLLFFLKDAAPRNTPRAPQFHACCSAAGAILAALGAALRVTGASGRALGVAPLT